MRATASVPQVLLPSTSEQAGVGLAVAVLIGPTVIRHVLLEAVMAVLGERNGCLPRRLPWLPGSGWMRPRHPSGRPRLGPPSQRMRWNRKLGKFAGFLRVLFPQNRSPPDEP